jgi:hypothetical protein
MQGWPNRNKLNFNLINLGLASLISKIEYQFFQNIVKTILYFDTIFDVKFYIKF